jgi:uncharacterized membrane protein YqaE (UPF0057 family)
MKHIRVDFGPFKNFYYLDTYYQLEKEIQEKYNLTSDLYYLTSGSQLINKNHNFNESNDTRYQVHLRLNGGMSPGKFFKNFLQFFINLGKLISGIPALFKWIFVDLLKWIIVDFLNPYLVLHDLVRGILAVIRIIALAVLDVLSGIARSLVNLVFEPIISGFWGYTPSEKEMNPKDASEAAKCAKGKRCFEQPQSKVAFPVIISTIILPPLGLFMELGLKGWMNLLLCAILTLFYYFPGLIYALIILYC